MPRLRTHARGELRPVRGSSGVRRRVVSPRRHAAWAGPSVTATDIMSDHGHAGGRRSGWVGHRDQDELHRREQRRGHGGNHVAARGSVVESGDHQDHPMDVHGRRWHIGENRASECRITRENDQIERSDRQSRTRLLPVADSPEDQPRLRVPDQTHHDPRRRRAQRPLIHHPAAVGSPPPDGE